MVAIHVFFSPIVSSGASVVYHETENTSNCSKKAGSAFRRRAGVNIGLDPA